MGMDRGARFDSKAGRQRIHRGIGQHVGRIEVELAAPDQPGLLALLDNGLEEAAKDLQAVAGADAGETRMVGKGFVEVVAEIPPHAQPVGDQAHQQPLGTHPFEKHDELEFEKDHWINARSSTEA